MSCGRRCGEPKAIAWSAAAWWQAPANVPTRPLAERVRIDDYASLRRARAGQETFLYLPWQHGAAFDGERALFDEAGVTSVLIEPITAGDEFVGVLLLENTLGDEFGATHFSAARSACGCWPGLSSDTRSRSGSRSRPGPTE